MSTVQVLLQNRSYAIRIVPGALADVGAAIRKECTSDRVVLLTTARARRLHGERLEAGLLAAGLEVDRIEVAGGERGKTLRTASRVYDQLAALHVGRGTLLVAFGGGALCDLAGFVASTYLRGLPIVQVPSTLRAQVDACVGGRTALHHRGLRNLVGTFYQPQLVWVDPQLLRSLPAAEIAAGMVAIVKVAVVWDAAFFEWLESQTASLLALEADRLADAITRAIQIRAEIVGLDERRGGLRALLHFGERFAEVVRTLEPGVGVGEASARGMAFAARLSCRRGWLEPAAAERLERLLEKVGMTRLACVPGEQKPAYLRALADDKKEMQGLPEWVLLRGLGRGEASSVVPAELMAELS